MFLFNKFRNGRQENLSGNSLPSVKWKTFLNSNPVFGAESTVVFDKEFNLYFGSHSGNFYSLNKDGEIRWVFTTKTKIYSSPLIVENKVYFVGGDGFVYCLDTEGNIIWLKDITKLPKENKLSKKLNFLLHFPFTYDLKKKKNIVYKSWCSPNHTKGKIFVMGYGVGLYCINLDGTVLWKFDLGFPRYQLSGVAIDENDFIYCSSRRGYAYKFDLSGKLIWKFLIKSFWEPWGNPVVCHLNQNVFFFFSKGEEKGMICCKDYSGNTKWTISMGAIRGSCSVSNDGNFIYCCDFNGFIYKISTQSGQILKNKKINSAQRGLWITPTLDLEGNILLSTKDGPETGRLIKLNENLEIIWEFSNNKILSVPVINENREIFIGSWDGFYYLLKN
jgi:outer membrane protein assembly factor BamB